MTNKEKYQKAFSALHASDNISLEEEIMEKNRQIYRMKKAAAACAAVVIAFGSITVAYAADLGGIQQKIAAWFHGEQVQMYVTGDGNGSYSYTYTDESGQTHEGSGGGVAIDDSGNESWLSAEEVMEDIGNDVMADEDGNIWLYYYDKKFNITDLFDEEGNCKVALEHEGKTIYFTIDADDQSENAVPGSYAFGSSPLVPEDAENYTMLK